MIFDHPATCLPGKVEAGIRILKRVPKEQDLHFALTSG
jgi:hypothetical protein